MSQDDESDAPRVLSIQSSVVAGHVGNTSSSFALQVLGFDVAQLHSVQLATHTGYPSIRGSRLSGDDVRTLIDGLRVNGLLSSFSGLLSGYVASSAVLFAVSGALREITSARALAGLAPPLYVMDPVLGDYNAAGDEGRLYVASELVDALRDAIKAGGVTLLTPNAFEAETLTGCPRIVDARGAVAAMDALHTMGARSVVITSSFVASAGGVAGDGHMLVFGSLPWSEVTDECGPDPAPAASMMGGVARRVRLWPAGPSPGTPFARFAVRVPRIPGSFTGTGDLMAALLFAHTSRDSRGGGVGGLVRAVELTLATMAAVCERTERAKARAVAAGRVAAAAAAAGMDDATAAKAQSAAAAELRLVESKSAIESPLVRADMQAFALDL